MNDNFDDDILTEVLKWLPVDKLFDFKSVCKRWNKIISSSYFRTIYQLSLVQHNATLTPIGFCRTDCKHVFVPASLQNHTDRADPYFKTDGFYFIDSSNGLWLFYNYNKKVYRVCNPVNKQCDDFPQPYFDDNNVAVAFNGHVKNRDSDNSFVLIFLEKSGLNDLCHLHVRFPGVTSWILYDFLDTEQIIAFRSFECAVVIKGVYYWLSLRTCSIIIYKLPCPQLGGGVLRHVWLPKENKVEENVSSVLVESKDGLLQYAMTNSCRITMWDLHHNIDGNKTYRWEMRCSVSFGHMYDRFPECKLYISREDLVDSRYDKMMAYHPSNPEIVFLFFNKFVISYCFHSRKVKLVGRIPDTEKKWSEKHVYHPPRGRFRMFPYTRIVPYFAPAWAASFL